MIFAAAALILPTFETVPLAVKVAVAAIFNEERFVIAPSNDEFPATVSSVEVPVIPLKLMLLPVAEVIVVAAETVSVFPKVILFALMLQAASTKVVPE